ncbi:lung seven transmembrane receptor-domain-containing protein [Pelagophyceae sp. CCMP2097]|nr:lung seven transmembrane receptor-domain-containing protein [Pelagophyceae sp. CCMP2097]
MAPSSAMVHDLSIQSDSRSLYRIESFCFLEGGVLEISVKDFEIAGGGDHKPYRVGFVMRRAASESAAQQELEESLEANACLLDWKSEGADGHAESVFELDMSDPTKWPAEQVRTHRIEKDEEGLYSLIFVRCKPSNSGAATSFKLRAQFYNPGPAYLSACEAALPLLFALFCAGYAVALAAWAALLLVRGGRCGGARAAGKPSPVHAIHWMMLVLLVFKTASVGSQSVKYHFINVTGSGEGWQFVYYAFASLKGVMLFVVILLIGTGWSLVKPYLSDREKKVVAFVLVLQVVDNVALIVFEEAAPGSRAWLTWRDVLHLVDIICCCAILFPIVWSIRHLRQAAAADGKTQHIVAKLTLFRQFYIMVVTYVYFTRIVVFLLAATLPFELLWLRHLFAEGATLIFYTVTGWKFRPTEDNPYLALAKSDDECDDDDAEYGEDDRAEQKPRGEAEMIKMGSD